MDSLRGKTQFNFYNNANLKFQIVDWTNGNEQRYDSESEQSSEDEKKGFENKKEYVIRAYGVTKTGVSISMNIYDFPPHYYINIPENWNSGQINRFIDFIRGKLPYPLKRCITKYSVIKRKKYWGFTNNELYKFIRIYFKNTETMDSSIRILNKELKIPGLFNKTKKFDLYESNIKPFIRFIHMNELLPAGWVEIKNGKYDINYDGKSNCQIDIDVTWKNVNLFETEDMAPLIIASFDIECDSSHGDFPLAKKDYKKLGSDVYDRYFKLLDLSSKNKSNKKKYNELKNRLNNKKIFFKNLISFGFNDSKNEDNINFVFTKGNCKPIPSLIDKLGEKTAQLIETKETYNLLAIDLVSKQNFEVIENDGIIKNIEQFISNFNKDEIVDIINDSLADNEEFKTNSDVTKIFTKGNKKPKKTEVDKLSRLLIKIYVRLFNQLLDLFEDPEETDVELIKFIISIYKEKTNLLTTDSENIFVREKIIEFLEINEYDINVEDLIGILDNMYKLVSLSVSQMTSKLKEYLPEIDDSRDVRIKRITLLYDEYLPTINGDKVIQIGTTIQKYGEREPYLRHMITLDTCDPIDNCEVVACNTERQVLIGWAKFIRNLDPDIITGYNIFGFDFAYMYHRAEELNCLEEFCVLGRIAGLQSTLECKTLSSSALGENNLYYITMPGRVQMDLFKVIQRDHNLVSYKLDYVAETFINDTIIEIEKNKLRVKGHLAININNYIIINYYDDSGKESKYLEGKKIKVIDKKEDYIYLEEDIPNSLSNPTWKLAKDDVSPQDIFRLQKGSSTDRKIVAVYCIQDCALCLHIINKLEIVTNNIGMANVCTVPLSYIFLRGQGVKIFSLVSKQCRKENFLVPVIKYKKEEKKIKPYNPKYEYAEEDIETVSQDDGYEGAIVLKPNPGIYLDQAVSVLDYASLYPSSMISENLSHDSIVLDKKYLGDEGADKLKKMGYEYEDISYDIFKWVDKNIKNKGKVKCGINTVRFVQFPNNEKGVIPRILQHLLKARKTTRKKIKYQTITTKDGIIYTGLIEETENYIKVAPINGEYTEISKDNIKSKVDTYSDFQKAVLDALQLAYKVTANSLYGQIGASTSPIYLKEIAASTTAIGRKLLYLAKDMVIKHMPGSDIVYGDTDSIFVNFNPKDDDGNYLKGKDALEKSIIMGQEFENIFRQYLKPPHNLEYEKTFWPFILLSKKRYVGNKYEFDTNKYKFNSMGIVLKRRDNAEIVKYVYGGIIDIIMNEKNINKSIQFLQTSLKKLLKGHFGLDMLVITKSLRGYYKNPNSIAHKVLADRMAERDPGNKPKSNDRIPFVYVNIPEKKGIKILQGDRVEHPLFIQINKLSPDYKFYITNQIQKPVSQIFGLIVETLPGFNKEPDYYNKKFKSYKKLHGVVKANNKITDLKNNDASELLFGETIRIANNKKNKAREITDFFGPKK